MSKVIFRRHPLDTKVEEGKTLTLDIKTLSRHNSNISWEFDSVEGWKEVSTSKTLYIKKVLKSHAGNYRCLVNGVCSRVAKVDVFAPPTEEGLEPTIEAPNKENDVFIEILEGTGEDASPELIEKVSSAIREELPEVLKV